ncbi:MAG: hypothetical protein ABFS05_09510 [Bacteroidota bacterium]
MKHKAAHGNYMKTLKKLINALILLAGLSILVSCKGETTFSKRINNQSDETITAVVYMVNGNIDSTLIGPKKIKEIYWDEKISSFVDASYSCLEEIDSISVTVTNNMILTKDIMDLNNWDRDSENGRNATESCEFFIGHWQVQDTTK